MHTILDGNKPSSRHSFGLPLPGHHLACLRGSVGIFVLWVVIIVPFSQVRKLSNFSSHSFIHLVTGHSLCAMTTVN